MRIGKKSGFTIIDTIIEVMFVIAVIAMLAAIFVSYVKKVRVMKIEAQPYISAGNGTFIKTGVKANDDTVKLVLEKVAQFETNHPDLRITGQQIMLSSGGSFKGIFLRHEPRTNSATLLEQTTHGR